jgi:aminoglycoside phosphotransferase (APT) family kinase protein
VSDVAASTTTPAESARLREYLDARLGDSVDVAVEPMVGGGSCDVYAVTRGDARWVLRQAPPHRSSATAHDVLREYRFLDAIKDQPVRIARPVLACDDPAVYGGPFYLMARIDGVPVRSSIPEAWTTRPDEQPRALEELVDALAAIHAVDWDACGLGEFARTGPYLERQIGRWLSQLESYDGRPLPAAEQIGRWLAETLPPDQPPALAHGDYKLDNVLFAESASPELLAVVDWEMASIGDPLVDVAWSMIFHPGPEGTMPLGVAAPPAFDRSLLPSAAALVARYGERTGRDVSRMDWYDVFSRWKLAIVLEGSYAKFLRGESKKPVHEFFGRQADQLLASAVAMVETSRR